MSVGSSVGGATVTLLPTGTQACERNASTGMRLGASMNIAIIIGFGITEIGATGAPRQLAELLRMVQAQIQVKSPLRPGFEARRRSTTPKTAPTPFSQFPPACRCFEAAC